MQTVNELFRMSKFLENHFSDNLGYKFTFKGQEIPSMSVFNEDFMLGIAAYVVDINGLNNAEGRIVKEVVPSDDGFFKANFRLNKVNGFKLLQIVATLESFLGINPYEDVPQGLKEFELSGLIDQLMVNYVKTTVH